MTSIKNLAVALSVAALTLTTAGLALAQSGSKPSGTPPPAVQKAVPAELPKVIALSFYADACPGCKMLKPKLAELMTDAGKQPCLFVKLDQSNKESREAEFLLAALGMPDLWKENAGHTGFVLLIDSKTKKVVGTLTPDQEAKAMKSTLMSALKG
ncbi:MAG: thioredoxin family protein [Planctomycetes bacterium]|nr:thioredoxin family protein [Planctomycetota bacterium]